MKSMEKERAPQSVPADGQPGVPEDANQNQLATSIPPPKSKCKKKLSVIDAETLMMTAIPKPEFIVESLLPQGIHLLAGSSKIGKSWLTLWVCLQVAKGEPVWNFKTNQGGVLYLALEDNYYRLQKRLLDITDTAPSQFHMAIAANSIHDGLCDQIRTYVSEFPSTKLIAIDTLLRVRGETSEGSAYANDYNDLTPLKLLAYELGIAILLIHHTRKERDADPINMISGTMGISAATDSNFALIRKRRGEKVAVLHCSGRDIEDRELELEMDSETHVWKLISDSVEEPETKLDPLILLVSDYVVSAGSFHGIASELLDALEKPEGVTPSTLSRRIMKSLSDLEQRGIRYSYNRKGDRREFSLIHDGDDGHDGNAGGGSTPQNAVTSVIAVTETDSPCSPPVSPCVALSTTKSDGSPTTEGAAETRGNVGVESGDQAETAADHALL